MPGPFAAFWSELNVDSRYASAFLSNCGVQLSAFGNVDPTPVIGALQKYNIRTDFPGLVHVVVVDDYQRQEIGNVNQACLSQKLPLLLIKTVGGANLDWSTYYPLANCMLAMS